MKISRMADTLGGVSVAVLIYIPMVRSLFQADTVVYFAAFGILAIATCLSPLLRRQNAYLYLFFFLICSLVSWILVSTLANGLPLPVSTLVLFLTTMAIGIICALRWGERFYRTVLACVVLFGVIAAIFLIHAYVAGRGDFRRTADSLGYLTAGALIALPVSLMIPHLLSSGGWKRFLVLFVMAPLCVGLIVALARGALLFTALAGMVALIFYWPRQESRRRKARTGLTTRLFVIGLAALATLWFLPTRTYILLGRLFSGAESQTGGRGDVWAHAWQEIAASPLIGHGLGHSLSQFYSHPHNMFLQVAMDGGIIGLIIIALIVVIPIVGLFAHWRKFGAISPTTIGFLLAFMVLVLDAQKSGDFYTARTLMIFAGLVLSHSVVQGARAAGSRATRRRRSHMRSERAVYGLNLPGTAQAT